jgi:hypothetical protein
MEAFSIKVSDLIFSKSRNPMPSEEAKRKKKKLKSLFWFELCNRFPLILCTAEKRGEEERKMIEKFKSPDCSPRCCELE